MTATENVVDECPPFPVTNVLPDVAGIRSGRSAQYAPGHLDVRLADG